MTLPIIKTSYLTNLLLIVLGLLFSGFFLLFGITNFINPDVADSYLIQNAIMCTLFCIIGLAFLVLAFAAFRGILYKRNKDRIK